MPFVLPWQAQASEAPQLAYAEVAMEDSPERRLPDDQDGDEEGNPESALERARELGLSGDDNRPDKQRETTLFGKPLIFGGELSTSIRGRSDYELERGANDDDLRIAPELKLEAIWIPSDTTVAFASVRAFAEQDIAREGRTTRGEAGLSLDSFWLLKTGLFGTPLAIQIGRQRLRERREFWWDDTIDGVRLHYFGSKVTAFAGVGFPVTHLSTLGRTRPEEKGQFRVFGSGAWEWKKRQHLELYALHQDDRSGLYSVGTLIARNEADDSDANLTWVGGRVRGCFKPGVVRRICYWGDLAHVRGTDTKFDLDSIGSNQLIVDGVDRTRVLGWAYDVGTSIELPLSFRPVITFARARGSGDRPGTPGINGSFRQTGLHSNDSKYRGLGRFRSYGEVLRPDLSNIRVTTLALGFPLGKKTWLESLWHNFRQPFADNRIRNSPIGENPDGIDPRLGNEFDIALSHRPDNGWEFELTAGAFRAGPAFGPEAGRWAGLVEVKIDYNF